MIIDPDKEKKALEIQRRNGLISEYRYLLSLLRLKYPNRTWTELVAKHDRENGLHTSHDACHMCRRDRNHISCMDCPRYTRRNWSERLELGMYASIVGLLVLIVIFYKMGIG